MIITVPIYLDAVEIVSHPIKDFDAKWREFLSKKVKNKGWEYIIQHGRGFDYEKEMFINDEQKLKFLTDKVNEKKLVVVDSLAITSNKTKDIKTLYNDLKLSGKVLFVADEDADKLYLATRNVPTALVLFADELNVYDVVDADYVVIDEKSLAQVEEVLK